MEIDNTTYCNLISAGVLDLSAQAGAVRSFNAKLEGSFNVRDRNVVQLPIVKLSSLGQSGLDICTT